MPRPRVRACLPGAKPEGLLGDGELQGCCGGMQGDTLSTGPGTGCLQLLSVSLCSPNWGYSQGATVTYGHLGSLWDRSTQDLVVADLQMGSPASP